MSEVISVVLLVLVLVELHFSPPHASSTPSIQSYWFRQVLEAPEHSMECTFRKEYSNRPEEKTHNNSKNE